MKQVKSLAVGFLIMSAAISVFSILTITCYGDAWLGLLYLMILAVPLSFGVYQLRTRKLSASSSSRAEKLGRILFALQGVALAGWAYDLATTFYAINVARIAVETNPLGWPLGSIGALSYYTPTVLLTYVLLFKLKAKVSLCAAVLITVVMLLMGSMNLNAGVGNFTFFVWTASLSMSMRYNLLVLVAAVDLTYTAILMMTSRKRIFDLRKLTMRK